MTDLTLYLTLGIEHIADINAYDHMLFIISLCVLFPVKDWKKILILITAFTIGHSITLALAALDKVNFDQDVIETLIPITILITCITNVILVFTKKSQSLLGLHYLFAIAFGLIHGLGFANYLGSLLMGMDSIILPLFAFNLGIEVGQLLIVAAFFLITYIALSVLKLSHKSWVLVVSSLVGLLSLYLIFQ